MDRDDRNRSRLAAGRRELFFHYFRIVAVVAAAVVLAMLLWYFLSPGHARIHHEESAETVSIAGAEKAEETAEAVAARAHTEEAGAVYAPTKDDGTGEAGVKRVTDGRSQSSGLSGWQNSNGKKWYEVARNTCYYGGWKEITGKIYYFDADGYAATGWKAISYQNGCYFDADGVYVPDKDKSKMICLTFDEGPSAYTSDILDILSDYGAKATFFVRGVNIEAYPDTIARIPALGNTLGSLSYTGADLGDATAERIEKEFQQADELIAKYSNLDKATAVRFPDGHYTKEGVAVLDRANILWDCETYDRETNDPNQIAANVYAQLQSGIVIRMHDISETVVEAVRIIVPELISQGYEFVNIKDMAASRGYELIPGATYLGFKQSDLEAGMVNDR